LVDELAGAESSANTAPAALIDARFVKAGSMMDSPAAWTR